MKKIKSINQLQSEKKRIKENLGMLERKISVNWAELKEELRPGNIAKDTISAVLKKKTEEKLNSNGLLKDTLTYGITLMAKKIVDKTREKLGHYFKN